MENDDREHYLRTNQFYIAQVNSMEIKISELKAQLHAKDFEIDYLTSKLSASQRDNTKPLNWHETELKLKIALQENDLLKSKISEFQEIHIVKSQLDQALHMKNLFEQKYRELKTQSMIEDKSSEIIAEKEERIKNLQQELQNVNRVVEENNEKLKENFCEIGELKKELFQRNEELEGVRRKLAVSLGGASLFKVREIGNWGQGSPGVKSGSASVSRKNSPDVKPSRVNTIRTNLQYQSPKINNNYVIRPKIVSISLESSLMTPPS